MFWLLPSSPSSTMPSGPQSLKAEAPPPIEAGEPGAAPGAAAGGAIQPARATAPRLIENAKGLHFRCDVMVGLLELKVFGTPNQNPLEPDNRRDLERVLVRADVLRIKVAGID